MTIRVTPTVAVPWEPRTPEALATATRGGEPALGFTAQPALYRVPGARNPTEGLTPPELVRVAGSGRYSREDFRSARPQIVDGRPRRVVTERRARQVVDAYRERLNWREGQVIVVSLDAPNYDESDQESMRRSQGRLVRRIPMRGETFAFRVRGGQLDRILEDETFLTSTVPTMNMGLWDADILSGLPSITQREGPAMIANGLYDGARAQMSQVGLDGVLFEDARSLPAYRDESYDRRNPQADGSYETPSSAGEIFAHSPVSPTIGCIAVHNLERLNGEIDRLLGGRASREGAVQWIVHRQ